MAQRKIMTAMAKRVLHHHMAAELGAYDFMLHFSLGHFFVRLVGSWVSIRTSNFPY